MSMSYLFESIEKTICTSDSSDDLDEERVGLR
jgi:hypothetical protein